MANKQTETTQPEVKKVDTTQPEVKKVDITPILKVIPDTFTPATLDKAFNLNDGGKTVRRHLRKHFAEELEHNKKDKWSFSKTQTNILTYFAERYTFNAEALKETKA